MNLRALRLVGASAIVAAIAGCAAAPSKVPNIAQNKLAYLQDNFSPDHLPKPITQAFAMTSVEPRFQKLVVKSDVTETKQGGNQPAHYVRELTLVNVGKGWVEQIAEWSSNDIPYSIDFSLNFMEIYSVRSQHVGLNDARPGAMLTIGGFTSMEGDVANPKEDAEYTFSGTWNNKEYSTDCKSEKYYDASTIFPALSGQALKVVCAYSSSGIVSTKATYAYLTQYGVYIVISHANSSSTTEFKTTAISAE